MFKEFIKPTEAQWQLLLEKELKGASLNSKNWNIEQNLEAKAFHFPKEKPTTAPLLRPDANWEICEDIHVASDAKKANAAALVALDGGAEGLSFQLENTANASTFHPLFDGIFIEYVGLGFAGPGLQENPGAVLAALLDVCGQKGIEATRLKGILSYQPDQSGVRPDWRYAADLLDFAKSEFPNIKLFELKNVEPFINQPIAELTALFKVADRHVEGLNNAGARPYDIAQNTSFCIEIGTSYFLEIAKLRAFQIVWLHFLQAWEMESQTATITVRFQPAGFTEEIYTNMIRSTTMAMSAVIGGAKRLVVLPHDAGFESKNEYGVAFSKRIARNVQHLLKSESYMNRIMDPAAGSYYIEDLTQQIAEAVWANLSQA